MSAAKSKRRSSTVAQKIDSYFQQDDDFDKIDSKNVSLLTDNDDNDFSINDSATNLSSSSLYEWNFRQTVSYWISISFIFGSLLFTSGSFFWIISDSLTSNDFYILVSVCYLAGGLAFVCGSYASYYGIINEANPNKKTRVFFKMNGKWSMGYISSLIFLVGGTIAKISSFLDLFKVTYDLHSFGWIIYKSCTFIGNFSFFIGGALAMHLNKYWLWRPYKLGWIVSWLNGIGGFLFFIAGIGSLINNQTVIFIMVKIPYLVGSFLYLTGSSLALLMWKLQQFGYIYLPQLNDNKNRKKRRKENIVLYRDIFFIHLYVVTSALAITAVSYSIQCKRYQDWIKNYLLVSLGSIGVLSLGSIIHKEPSKPPFNYLIWFLRFYMTFYTINLCIDTYHLSGSECNKYGN